MKPVLYNWQGGDMYIHCKEYFLFSLKIRTFFEQTYFEVGYSSKEISKTSNCLLSLKLGKLWGIRGSTPTENISVIPKIV